MPYTSATGTTASTTLLVCPQSWSTGTTTTITTPFWTLPWTVTTSGWQWRTGPAYQYSQPSRAELDRIAADQRRRQADRARVSERAEALLLSLLDPDQARSYAEAGWFEVRGSAGGRFRIRRRGQAGNVDELPVAGEDRIASYCAHPSGGFPDADAHVAQFLALVTDEEGFRRTANRTPRGLIAA